MDDNANKTLVSTGGGQEKKERSSVMTVPFELLLERVKKATGQDSFSIPGDEYWDGWPVLLHENYFINLFLDAEQGNQITDAQVQRHFNLLQKFIEQLEDLERAGTFNQNEYPGLNVGTAKANLEAAFQSIGTRAGREQYFRSLDKKRYEAGKEKTMPTILKAFEDGVLEIAEEEILITVGKSNGLTEAEITKLIEEVLHSNTKFKRVDSNSVLEDRVKIAVAEEIAAMQNTKEQKKNGLKVAGALAGILFIVLLFYIPVYNEGNAWESAQKENTESAYTHYLAEYPTGKHSAEASRLKEELVWQSTRQRNTEAAYNTYMELYPQGRYTALANESREPLMWQRVRSVGTENIYNEYLQKYPNGMYAANAKSIRESLLWSRIRYSNSSSLYQEYLALYPYGVYSAIARKNIEALNAASRTAEEATDTAESSDIDPTASRLTDSELSGKSKWELKILRNEIYARHGYVFKSPELRDYFNRKSWYSARNNNVEGMLSATELYNVQLLKKYEEQR